MATMLAKQRPLEAIGRLPGVYQIRRAKYQRTFLRSSAGPFWGQFETAAAARDFLPERLRSTYDNPDLIAINLELFSQIHLFDWPILFQLERLLNQGLLTGLTDYGGHVGVKYYAYREQLRFPSGFRWQVVDVPAMASEGRRRAEAGAASELSFFDRIESAPPCDVLLCSGVLQYGDLSVPDILARMERRPAFLILNKLPIVPGAGFFTLENFGRCKLPYQVFNDGRHAESLETAGYRLATRWRIPERDFEVPFIGSHHAIQMIGEVWSDQGAVEAVCTF